ncbi:hypothetical protein EOD42_14170 [Rhodovarius crocodyli]|uniref:Tail assembly protein n=1 Tax=Rhodovarius crocodyli TaxID=1979269 RepID=A0A437MF18_9PROT|nr:tail assembly protein [Rhodovarius crocodyli]RVT96254.1 hypothetical protein EOD42_14170 [Rhodovarius crocodyli]
MNTIHLHGPMRKQFGGPFTLAVRTPAEAIHALNMQLPGFEEAIRSRSWRVVRGSLKKGRSLPSEQLGVNLGGEMHLVAAAEGAGGRGTGKIIIGALLLVTAAVLTAGFGGAAGGAAAGAGEAAGAGAATATQSATAAAFGTVTGSGLGTTLNLGSVLGTSLSVSAGKLALFGAAMLFGGISQALSSTPKAGDTKRSFLFNGSVNPAEQGVPVPLAFGKPRTGGVIIAVAMETTDF